MHELSIAQNLIDLVCEAAAEKSGLQIQRVQVEIGALTGVVKEALEFSFALAAEGTVCEGAVLEVKAIPATALCLRCHKAQPLTDSWHFVCPVCGAHLSEIISGRELNLVVVEINEHAAANP